MFLNARVLLIVCNIVVIPTASLRIKYMLGMQDGLPARLAAAGLVYKAIPYGILTLLAKIVSDSALRRPRRKPEVKRSKPQRNTCQLALNGAQSVKL